jgi:hypothetical protein
VDFTAHEITTSSDEVPSINDVAEAALASGITVTMRVYSKQIPEYDETVTFTLGRRPSTR